MNAKALLESFSQRLFAAHGLRAVTAAEIEFYCPAPPQQPQGVLKLERERGEDQYEIALPPASPAETVAMLEQAKILLQNEGADFSAKPRADQPGSGLHIHLHLENAQGERVFWKKDDAIAAPLQHSLGGLLALLPPSMFIFAPAEASYARFAPRGQTPTTLSWGANNRTVALRIPDGPHKRIEHRVAGADADPASVMAAVLAGVVHGLDYSLVSPLPQTYGDATLESYGLPPLPRTLAQAREMATLLSDACPALAALLPES